MRTVTLLQAVYLPGGDRPIPAGTALRTTSEHADDLVLAGLAEDLPEAAPKGAAKAGDAAE